ncbi:autophagy associated protein Atg24 [Schizosaccharomyces cryophilus OY26]|uniref:Sorting nexin-4 n=1 Tax=Schizosaccharomyces cryophilus (strain OY26 / ATCC MYA-4695 / CBS 11777 / NBRC 106824 / NRRL Y48691) TaxID=653667 RepID=S9W5H3_SCHCR|nr:autophagy associated protein Atg24 [Schizosaccharomyces cryophilus OY26]EPY53205.1 autophagy associated protein Atg24 [Schizosaccharomyces cryophilus OY26]
MLNSIDSENPPPSSTPFIECFVTEPRKELQGSRDAHVSYLIITKTNSPLFTRSECKVRRRFSDFVKLQEILSRLNEDCVVPPLPAKHKLEYIKGNRFSENFINRRASLLNRYITRCAFHPVLHRSPHFIAFLENPNWNNYVRYFIQPKLNTTSKLDEFSDSLLNAFSKLKEEPTEFDIQRDHVQQFMLGISNLETSIQRIVRLEKTLETDYEDVSTQFDRLASLDRTLEIPVESVHQALQKTGEEYSFLIEKLTLLLDTIKDVQSYAQSLKELLKRRDQKQQDVEALQEYSSKLSLERDKISSGGSSGFSFSKTFDDLRGVDHNDSRLKRLEQVQSELQAVEQAIQEASIIHEAFNQRVREESKLFDNVRQSEMLNAINEYANIHVEFFTNIRELWLHAKQ